MRSTSPASCPCGAGPVYADCCGRAHAGVPAATALALMRSRYSAFATGDTAYLLRTWHISTRPVRLDLDDAKTWTGLEIVDTRGGSLFERTATVRFVAHYRLRGVAGSQTENSRFVRDGNEWFYVDASG